MIFDWLHDLFGEALGYAILIGVILVLAIPVYLVLKVTGLPGRPRGRKTTFREDVKEAIAWRAPSIESLPPERQAFLRNLQSVDRGVSTFYEYFLYVVMGLATGFIIFFFAKLPRDSNFSFLQAYFGGGYIIVMLLLVSQVIIARRRRTRPPLGFTNGPGFQVRYNPVQTVQEVHTIGADVLQKAEILLQKGGSLDDACRQIDPQFDSRNRILKQAFRQAIQAALDSRRAATASQSQNHP